LLRVSNLSVKINQNGALLSIIDTLDFELLISGITVLTGTSGIGKTIFAKSLSGLLDNRFIIKGDFYFNNGKIQYKELENNLRNFIFYIPQNARAALNPAYKIKYQFNDLKIHKTDKLLITIKKLNFNNPERILNSYPHELSEGQCQRIIFAMGVLLQKEILILDEPFSSIDDDTQKIIVKSIINLNFEKKTSILIITHKKDIIKLFNNYKSRISVKNYNFDNLNKNHLFNKS